MNAQDERMPAEGDNHARDVEARKLRRVRLRSRLADDGLAGLLVFDLHNIRYLTGFSGTTAVVAVLPDEVVLLTDFRYRLQAADQAPDSRYLEIEQKVSSLLPEVLVDVDGPIGIEDSLSVARWRSLEDSLAEIEYRIAGGHVEQLRRVKGSEELEPLRRAGQLLAQTIGSLAERPVVGRAESDVALALEVYARERGSAAPPFDFILAGGARGAMPHAEASAALIEPDGLLVVDIGTEVDGYASDMTRTFATGRINEEKKRIFDVVRKAQEKARHAARAGITCRELDAVARDVIAEAGYAAYFGHGLGHGVGLAVHEAPRVSRLSEDVLKAGMVVTIEPGIYIPGVGGVRIEDTVLIEEDGIEILTPLDHGWVRLT
ncbi:MAG TPA: aminopeptidase P family protein [Thermoleophilia bacterium]|nr:aminopeptidase P family protein [Thermoleophilia bacterium]